MPNLLLVISGVRGGAFVLRETLEDMQKKEDDQDGQHGRFGMQG